jgi:hypothetical protein
MTFDPSKFSELFGELSKRRDDEIAKREEILGTILLHHGKKFHEAAALICRLGDIGFNLLLVLRLLPPDPARQLGESLLKALLTELDVGIIELGGTGDTAEYHSVASLLRPIQQTAVDAIIENQRLINKLMKD